MPRGKTKFDWCVKAVKRKGSAVDPRAVCGAMRKLGMRDNPSRFKVVTDNGELLRSFGTKAAADRYAREVRKTSRISVTVKDSRRDNPADSAALAYEIFHGEKPTQFTRVSRDVHFHKHLWSVGTLKKIVIRTRDGRHKVSLAGFKGAFLAANEQAFSELSATGKARAQLFIEGGDQSVTLKDFGIDAPHEVETLGEAVLIDYATAKVHLGDEGGDATYRHKFRTTREGDAHVTVRWARYPDVIYRVLDQHLEFSGGSYELRAEGIDR